MSTLPDHRTDPSHPLAIRRGMRRNQRALGSSSALSLALAALLGVSLNACDADNPVEDRDSASPVFSPDGGVFANPVEVNISSRDDRALVLFSRNGSAFSAWTGPLVLSQTTSIVAQLSKDGRSGPTVSRTFEIKPTTRLPLTAIRPSGGSFENSQTVSLTTASPYPGTAIRYTTDTTSPVSAWILYEQPFIVSKRTVVRAITVADGRTNSLPTDAIFRIEVASPSIAASDDSAGWNDSISYFTRRQTVTMTTRTVGATIRYTLDGSRPDANSEVYSAPVQVLNSATIQAIATKDGMTGSGIARRRVEICAIPVVIDPPGGTFLDSISILLSSKTDGAAIHFTLDGSTPTTSSPLWSAPIAVRSTATLRAISVKEGLSVAPAAEASFIRLPPWNNAVSFSSMTDPRDDRTYRTVQVGRQTWIAENLAYAQKGICQAGRPDSCAKYGRLYTWVEAMDLPASYASSTWSGTSPRKGLCPTGWHLPASSEWDTLFASVRRSTTALLSSSGWNSTTVTTDSVGFRGLPGGYYDTRSYRDAGTAARFWSSTSREASAASAWNMLPHANWVLAWAKTNAMSVRCLKD